MRVYGTHAPNWGRGPNPDLVGCGPRHRLGPTDSDPHLDLAAPIRPADELGTVLGGRPQGGIVSLDHTGQRRRVGRGAGQGSIAGPRPELTQSHGRAQSHQQDNGGQGKGLALLAPETIGGTGGQIGSGTREPQHHRLLDRGVVGPEGPKYDA